MTSRRTAIVGAGCVAALLLTACSSSGGSGSSATSGSTGNSPSSGSSSGAATRAVNVGLSAPITVKGKTLNVAFLNIGTLNTFGEIMAATAKSEAQQLGINITVYDANFDPQTQLNQAEDALNSGKYNAMVFLPLDGSVMCQFGSQTAPKAGVMIVNIGQELCGRADNPASGIWQPGTVSQIGIQGSLDGYRVSLAGCAQQLAGPQKMVLINGPADQPATDALAEAAQQYATQTGGSVLANLNVTQETPAGGQQVAENALESHPTATLLVSLYSGMTEGIMVALRQAGKLGKVHVCDNAGVTKAEVPYIENGDIAASQAQLPSWDVIAGLKEALAVFNGAQPIRVVQPDAAGTLQAYNSASPPQDVTAKNVASYPAYNG
jgi:ribose transport system substrate-binding protein